MQHKHSRRLGVALVGLALALVPAAVATAHGFGSSDPSSATLDKKVSVGIDSDARRWNLGGFSGLFPLDSAGTRFLTLTDRGPNGDITCNGVAGKSIQIPAYAPRLIEFSVDDRKDRIELDRVRPFRVGTQLATGLANIPGDEASFTSSCTQIPTDPLGVDSEGVALDPRVDARDLYDKRGSLWLADEYRPSVLFATGRGELLARIVPKGITGDTYAAAVQANAEESGNGLAVHRRFPAIVGEKFRKNRGFEDVAVQRIKGRTYVYTALQSPMENPDTTGRNSLALRVFRIDATDVRNPVVDREWLHLLEVKPTGKGPRSDKVSSLWPAGPDKLLIEERDDARTDDPAGSTKLWKVDFSKATNLLGGKYDDVATAPTLEQLLIPAANGVVPPAPADAKPGSKSLCADVNAVFTAAGLVNQKLEGMALVRRGGRTMLAAVNDNDFDIDHITDPILNPTSKATTIDYVQLPKSCGM